MSRRSTRRSGPGRPQVRSLMDGLHATFVGFKQMSLAPIARAGVTPAQFWVMNMLGESGELACGPLATRLGVKRPSVTVLVDPLEKAGYVRRARSSSDRRVVRLELTPQGTGLVAGVWRELEDEVADRVAHVAPGDLERAAAVLSMLGKKSADRGAS
jgi:DNA-binding MarR family transcriptional regulator